MPKFPEKGYDDGLVFGIRKNMNFLTKGLARTVVGRNGDVDLRSKIEYLGEFQDSFTRAGEWTEENKNLARMLAGYSKMNKDEKNDFDTFLECPHTYDICSKFIENSIEHYIQLAGMSYAMEVGTHDAEHQEAIKDSMPDYENAIYAIQRAAIMDVDKEMEILTYGNCDTMAIAFNTFGRLARNERSLNSGYEEFVDWENGHNRIMMDSASGNNRFFGHAIFGQNVKIGKKDVFVTLENTAPPAEKAIFKPKGLSGAIGIYDSREECVKQYLDDNEIGRSNVRACAEIRNVFMNIPDSHPLNSAPRVTSSTRFLHQLITKEGKGHRNSQLFTNVMENLKELRDLEDTLLEHPKKRNDKAFMDGMKEKYQALSASAQTYLNERKGAITILGKSRLELMQSILDHSQRKEQAFTNVMKEPNPVKAPFSYDEASSKRMAERYKRDEEAALERARKEEERRQLEAKEEAKEEKKEELETIEEVNEMDEFDGMSR